MNRWKSIIALLLAMLYLPATGHCALEQVGWIDSAGACCDQTALADNPQTDSCSYECCPIEYALYLSAPHSVSTSPQLAAPVLILLALRSTADDPQHVAPRCPPPVPPKAWQFAFRTALPARAPSCLS
ncbi:MAG: hypothetical protein ACTHLW_03630 [Verrucomicrobiota bacterium]